MEHQQQQTQAQRQQEKDFGCGAGGDIVKFVREINGGIGFAEGVRQLSGESESLRTIASKPKRIKQESPKCNPLSVEARHDSHKKLVKAFGLASWRKNHLIKDRGLTPDEVRWCIEQGFIFDWETGTTITGVSRQLAGVDPNNGQLVGELGMAIADAQSHRPSNRISNQTRQPQKGRQVCLGEYKLVRKFDPSAKWRRAPVRLETSRSDKDS